MCNESFDNDRISLLIFENGEEIMKKVLIYLRKGDLLPAGGPRGYNYNLLEGLTEMGVISNPEDIEIHYMEGKSVSLSVNKKMNSISNNGVKTVFSILKSVLNKGILMYGFIHRAKADLNQYDAVHFHSVVDLYSAKNDLKNYRGKVFLTSHNPTAPSKEIYSNLSNFEKKYLKRYYRKLKVIEEFAFDNADYIVFPCAEAEEPYYHDWPNYSDVHKRNAEKYLYMLTGTGEKITQISKHEIRAKYGIPDEAFVVAYVGRHNEIKGYDSLKRIASKILDTDKEIYFLIAGKEGPLYRLESEQWIEIGWTKEPGAVINGADIFILPNRETYFDLVMLEVLSLGQIVLATNTGGNKFFNRYSESGIYLYETESEVVSLIHKLAEHRAELELRRQENKRIYEANFTNLVFARNYVDLLRKVLN